MLIISTLYTSEFNRVFWVVWYDDAQKPMAHVAMLTGISGFHWHVPLKPCDMCQWIVARATDIIAEY